MKRIASALLASAALAVTASIAQAAPGDGIAGTDHDFSGGAAAAGLCTYCHTPHKALKTVLLWNHKLSANTFSWDETATTAGTVFPSFAGGTYKGPTAKCLSCHDGSVAIGDINWWNGGTPTTPLNNTQIGQGDSHNVGFGGAMAGNHPVAMPYPYLGVQNSYNGVTTGSGFVSTEWVSNPATNGIRLFNDSNNAGSISAGAVALKTGIECSSCHDPHNKASTDDFFLRGMLGGATSNYICLKCHIK